MVTHPYITTKDNVVCANKSADNAQAAMAGAQPAPVIVNAPTNVNNSSKQNITIPTPIRNDDNGFMRYISNTSYIGA